MNITQQMRDQMLRLVKMCDSSGLQCAMAAQLEQFIESLPGQTAPIVVEKPSRWLKCDEVKSTGQYLFIRMDDTVDNITIVEVIMYRGKLVFLKDLDIEIAYLDPECRFFFIPPVG